MPMHANIIELTKKNTFFRQVIATANHCQVVLMSIEPKSEIGYEKHNLDQILIFVEGQAEALVGEKRFTVMPNDMVLVPAETYHNFINSGSTPLKLFTIYAPAQHAPNTIHKTKEEADKAEHY